MLRSVGAGRATCAAASRRDGSRFAALMSALQSMTVRPHGIALRFEDEPVPRRETHRPRVLLPEHPGLKLLVRHGSRARGDTHAGSDWDFAFKGTPELDLGLLDADLAIVLGTDAVDLADLGTAGGLLRYRVARDGMLIHEATPGAYHRFWLDALSFWCDAGPIIERGYEAMLSGLKS